MTNAREPERKDLGRAPQNKDAGRSSREGEEPEGEEVPFGPDGCYHVMQAEMEAAALDRDLGPENEPPKPPPVIHVMELQMKGEAVGDYIEENPHRDQTLPTPEEPPLPGKPPTPPLGGEGRNAEDARRAQEQVRKQNDPGKRR